jgi:tetratricopeptide (TPR) repeat protein
VSLFRELGERFSEAWTLNGLGEATHAAGRPADALAHHTAACAIADEIGSSGQQARAHAGLGHAHQALGELTRARRHYEHALALYTRLGLPEADEVRAHLTTLGVSLGVAPRPTAPARITPNGEDVTAAQCVRANGATSSRGGV